MPSALFGMHILSPRASMLTHPADDEVLIQHPFAFSCAHPLTTHLNEGCFRVRACRAHSWYSLRASRCFLFAELGKDFHPYFAPFKPFILHALSAYQSHEIVQVLSSRPMCCYVVELLAFARMIRAYPPTLNIWRYVSDNIRVLPT